jgi:hypothetical protein
MGEGNGDMGKYSLHLEQSRTLPLADEPGELEGEHCLTEIIGTILDDGKKIGYVKARLIDFHRAGDDLWFALDGESGELEGFYSHVFGKYAGVMRPAVAKVYSDDDGDDMFYDPALYVEKIEVNVAHRGRGVGLMAMNTLLTHFRYQVTLAFCKPYPLYSKRDPDRSKYFDPKLAKLPRRQQVAALQRYWSKAGFRKLERGPYFVVNVRKRASALPT